MPLVLAGIFLLWMFTPFRAAAQLSLRNDTVALPFFQIGYAFQITDAHLAERFENVSSVHGGFQYKNRSNWTLGVSGSFLFGGRVVQQGVIESLRTDQGRVINASGNLTQVEMSMRGFRAMVSAGKVIRWLGPNPNSGLWLQLGAGLLQHQIHFRYGQSNVPQLDDPYEKGYDRLSNGWAVAPQLTYLRFDNDNFINFKLGLDVSIARTESRRAWNFEENRKIEESRWDLMWGLKAAWVFPIFDKQSRVQRQQDRY